MRPKLRATIRQGGRLDAAQEARRRERAELERQRLLALVERTRWPKLEVGDLSFSRYVVEHADGTQYRVCRGEASELSPISAYYVNEAGDLIFLEPAR